MTTRLLVEATDVAGAPLRGARADAAVDGSTAFAPLQPSADGLELNITGATHVDLKVVANGFWEVFQALDIGPGLPPTVEPTLGSAAHNPYDYHINVDPPTVSGSGNDWEIRVPVRLSRLRDAEKRARAILAYAHQVGWAAQWHTAMDFDLTTPFNTALVGKFLLGPEGAQGPDRLNITFSERPPGGSIYFLERTTTPKLVIVWRPDYVETKATWHEDRVVPLHYHLFFHPAIPWPDHPPGEEKYPWNFDSLNLAHRYLMGKPDSPADPRPHQLRILRGEQPDRARTMKNKAMLNQLVEAESPFIFVFPVGAQAGWLNDITTQASALVLLQEVNHFLQRREANDVAAIPIGEIAVSGFSFGYTGVTGLMQSPTAADFDQRWTEVYDFDGNQAGAPAVTRKWLLANPARRVRVYTQSSAWKSLIPKTPFEGVPVETRFGATEIDSSAGTIFVGPGGFWSDSFGPTGFNEIHQVIPALFLHHAARRWFKP